MLRVVRSTALVGLMLVSSIMTVGALKGATSDAPVADAAMRGDEQQVRALLKDQAADVNTAQADGMTALHWAARNGDRALAQLLIVAGANTGARTRLGGYTPLHLAARNGQAALVETLLEGGADAKSTDAHGTTPLMFAAQAGIPDAIAALIAHGADVNAVEAARGETALMFASAAGRTDAVKALLAHGADWRPTTKVLDWTKLPKDDPRLITFNRPQAARASQGTPAQATPGQPAVPTPAQKVVPTTPAKPAAGPSKVGTESRIGRAGGSGPRPLSYIQLVGTQGGLTALMFAARQGHLETVKALVAAGADVNEVDAGDETSPLLIATINGEFDVAMYLLDHGADPNKAEANGATPLYDVLNCVWAPKAAYPQPQAWRQQRTAYLDVMQALLDHGADPNARLKEKVWYTGYNFDQSGIDEAGATPFWLAAYSADVDAMKLLVAHAADPAIPTMKTARRTFADGGGGDNRAKDRSGLPPIPIGGPGVPPLLAAAGEGYGSSFTANHHQYAPTGMLASVRYLVEDLHADVNARDADGNTPLHNAAARGDNAMINYLVSKGADVKTVNRKGQSVADMANGPFQRVQPFPDTVALLEKLGAQLLSKCVSC